MESKYYAKKIFLFLLYLTIFCTWGSSECHSRLFYTMFPLMSIYYAILCIPKVFRIYEYNLKVHSIPRFTYLWRFVYHLLLFEDNFTVGFISGMTMIIILMWKDLRFLITHAEEKLRKIDQELYTHHDTKHLRFAHMHLNTFNDDTKMRYHEHYFNTNKTHLVNQSTDSDTTSNGILNYYEYRETNKEAIDIAEANKSMWLGSYYTSVFIKQRNIHMLGPIIYILICLLVIQQHTTAASFYLYRTANTFLVLIDIVCTLKVNRYWNDLVIDFSYCFVACVVLAANTYRICNT